MTERLTDHIDTIRDALLQSAGTLRLLHYSEALPLRFREEIDKRVEGCEAGIDALFHLSATLSSAESDPRQVEEITELATVTMAAVKLLALPQK